MFVFTRRPGHRVNGLQRGHYAKSMDPRRDRCGWGIVCCPDCGRLFTVGRNHDVSANGTMTPSLVCPFGGCGFHVFARLGDWAKAGLD